ncbi:hypothetical protein [Corynebacterium cystitidis]|uniref:Uncharacterized protein n=1 Tax=Corynebacterium cystitidis DSM 20524 TaxID=1121357 RepID=A0A1H9VWD8_9CORY|nr:hypothetical protein [Corynebacterium cystitidis]WJY81138.1 hypothetical protein CCYS_00770 [Corynebacterium cystitidis DSM 20524]SES25831.1 hypothetical protein SAMN05661109_02426 [Corynebacterium cystitidis DSM 20524]SNV89806.1 Uncharacterised protein [Corynebacterium cystitidis]
MEGSVKLVGVMGSEVVYRQEAPRPPFKWRVELPPTFCVLDIHPETWRGRIDRTVEAVFSGFRLKSAQKRQAGQILSQAVKAAQDAGAVAVLLKGGVVEGSVLSVASLTFGWMDSSPQSASLVSVEEACQGALVEYGRTRAGVGWVLAESTRQSGPMTDRRDVYVHQGFLPLAQTTWTLVVSGVAPSLETSETMRKIVTRVVNSVDTVDDFAGDEVAATESQFGEESAWVVVSGEDSE